MSHKPVSFGSAALDASQRQEILQAEGPRLRVILRSPAVVSELSGGISFLEKDALIDTGASVVCIDSEIAKALNLDRVDRKSIGVVGSQIEADIFAGVLEVPQLQYKKLIQFFAPVDGVMSHPVLLGRSFLKEFIVTYDGPKGIFHFSSPAHFSLQETIDD